MGQVLWATSTFKDIHVASVQNNIIYLLHGPVPGAIFLFGICNLAKVYISLGPMFPYVITVEL